jgi:hypothetical protein
MLILSISFPDLIKISYFMDTLETRVILQIILVFTLTCPKPFTRGHVCVKNLDM